MTTDDEWRKWARRGQWSSVITFVGSLGATAAIMAESPDWLPISLIGITIASEIYGAMRPTHPRA